MTIVSQDRLLVCNYANIAKISIYESPTGWAIDADGDPIGDYGSMTAAQNAIDGLVRALRLDGKTATSGVYTFPADMEV